MSVKKWKELISATCDYSTADKGMRVTAFYVTREERGFTKSCNVTYTYVTMYQYQSLAKLMRLGKYYKRSDISFE